MNREDSLHQDTDIHKKPFKIGDKVVIMGQWKGVIVEIKKVNGGNGVYKIGLLNGEYSGYLEKEEIEHSRKE